MTDKWTEVDTDYWAAAARAQAAEMRRLFGLPDDAPVAVRLPSGPVGDALGEALRDDPNLVVDPEDTHHGTAEARQQAVERLAAGLDLPPDVLLGSGGAHWTAARDAQRADMGLPFYVLACLEGGPDTVLPFSDPTERGRWAAEHRLGTGHDRWWCMDLSGGADG